MRSLLVLLLAVLLAVSARGQDRHVTVQLLDGETIEGTVVSMDSAALCVQVRGQVRSIEATRIRSCRFDPPAPAEAQPEPVNPAAALAAPAAPAAKSPQEAKSKPAVPPQGKAKTPHAPQAAPETDPAIAAIPHDVRHRSLLRARLDSLDEAYRWLQPTAPMQWLSLGLLLAIALSLTVHASVRIVGAEAATLPRSASIGLWYLVSGFAQVAGVPANNLTIVLMLLANPTIALFLLTTLFGLTRTGALIAFAVQLGVGVLGFGVLELVTAVLGSIAPATT